MRSERLSSPSGASGFHAGRRDQVHPAELRFFVLYYKIHDPDFIVFFSRCVIAGLKSAGIGLLFKREQGGDGHDSGY